MRGWIHEIPTRERLAVDDGHAGSEGRLSFEVEADWNEVHTCTGTLRAECHPSGTGPQRHQASCRMADPFGKDADRISVGERGIDSCECLGVLRHVGTLIELAVDRNRS